MQFRDLKAQYQRLKPEIDNAVQTVLESGRFIGGEPVEQLEKHLSEYTGVKHCITCANGTDALEIALMVMGVGKGDAVFVPDLTFFATAEAPASLGATPVFTDIDEKTFNMSPESLERAIRKVIEEKQLKPKVVIPVDLYGLPANHPEIKKIADKYGLLVLEDGAQGFGGRIGESKACSFGDISTTSFFPAKPLGCCGDGGAIFTDNDNYAGLARSICFHGKSGDKYDNVRIGRNSRLDTIQAAILLVKLKAFIEYELEAVNKTAEMYTELISEKYEKPVVPEGYYSSWAQYTIKLPSREERDALAETLKGKGIPTMIYYPIPMHRQKAFRHLGYKDGNFPVTERIVGTILSLPMGADLRREDILRVSSNG